MMQILGYLDPCDISPLLLVSKGVQKLCLDDELWKQHSFHQSPWYQALITRRYSRPEPIIFRAANANADEDEPDQSPPVADEDDEAKAQHQRSHRIQDMANWDPAFPEERVSWYDEYMQRSGPASINWMQTPKVTQGGIEAIIESHGLALYNPYNGDDGLGTMLAVSPLEDGSVCLWDVKGSRGKQGSIVAKSKADILFQDAMNDFPKKRSKMIDSSISDRITIDNTGHRAFVAVQSQLIEIDLNRLDVVSRESFEWSIMTLSAVHAGVPLTVGTSLGIHLHDFRSRARAHHDVVERVDRDPLADTNAFKGIFDQTPLPPYASLSQATPTSILHLPRQGAPDLASDDIYVSGRFSNILHYDRRKFPVICGTIYSGALINGLTALPYPFSKADYERRQQGELSLEQMEYSKTRGGQTLIAGGAYSLKGSLELYGLSPDSMDRMTMQGAWKNRYTAASSTILSVANHGTKIVFSDGSGLLKWFERDGTTECRRLRIGHSKAGVEGSMFESMPGTDDVARKILSTQSRSGEGDRPNNDNILFWTGERLGMASFAASPLFLEKDFDMDDPEKSAEEEARQEYASQMRKALQHSADEVRFMGNLGLR
ncbi:unnamed protein product [Clonostachys byssicola]|uniref:F-box domain-containing protein n=1 Tax=Clonostachys byssicola TaxID=160290 RepID=A0A9N9UJE6_9HYPO|nr:unnamed protein product [Clonostachys byssicola]